jgi:hypothetical protein
MRRGKTQTSKIKNEKQELNNKHQGNPGTPQRLL